jgi:hypothetical protein
MSKTFQVGAGNKVKLYVALLPLGDRTEPTDVSLTTSAAIASAATTIAVTALTGPIAGGTPLTFSNGTDKLTVYLAKDAKAGATTLNVEATTSGLTGSSSTAEYTAKLRLLGGTQLNANINSDRTDVLVFEDLLGQMMKRSAEYFLRLLKLFRVVKFLFGRKMHHPQVLQLATV